MKSEAVLNYFSEIPNETLLKWRKKNSYFYNEIEKFHEFLIGKNKTCVEVGAGTGNLLNALQPKHAIAVDSSRKMLDFISSQYPKFTVIESKCEELNKVEALKNTEFDYIIANGLLSSASDVQMAIRGLASQTKPHTRIILSTYNTLWEPLLTLGAKLGIRAKTPLHNWLSDSDLENLLFVED